MDNLNSIFVLVRWFEFGIDLLLVICESNNDKLTKRTHIYYATNKSLLTVARTNVHILYIVFFIVLDNIVN